MQPGLKQFNIHVHNIITSYKNILFAFLAIIFVMALPSCALFTVVRNEPKDVPFIFETTVNIKDKDIKKDEKARLEGGLIEQLDDSIAARKLDKVFWQVLKNPTTLDTSLISKSMEYMHYYLHGEGYFHDSMTYNVNVKENGEQQRAYINFNVWPNHVTRIDSLTYTFTHDSLQALVDNNKKDALLKTGDPFAQGLISAEMDRLVDVHRNNGYLLFTRNNLYGLWDTLDIKLLQPSLDPFEYAEQLARLRAHREQPTANLDIRLKPQDSDSAVLKKYYIGNITVYPDTRSDTAKATEKRTTYNNVTIVQHANKFRPGIFPQYIYLKHGELYKQSRYMRTVNRFNSLGSWRLVDMARVPRQNEDTVDFVLRLTPAPKYSFSTNVEGNFSQSLISGNFVGLGLNAGLQNRNFLKGANTFNTNARYGVELGGLKQGQFIQTQQVSLSNALIFPRFVFPGMKGFKDDFRGNVQSVLSLNAANTERRFLFNLTSFNTSWGYEFTWRTRPEKYLVNGRTFNLVMRLPNIEYSYITRRDSLLRLIENNPSINNLFSDGLITSTILNFSMPWNSESKKVTNVFRTNIEGSGLITGFVRNKFLDDKLYRFIKIDAELAKLIKLSRNALVLRGFAGVGYEFESTRNPDKRSQLPFFKQYYSGGPNSMRAWQLRRLGPGSAVKKFEGAGSVPDRFGDVQLEGNIEYRLPLANIAGIPINGAVFTDVGNVWFLKKDAGLPDETFKLSRLGTDLAVGSGAGVRVDFGFFVIRLDYAYKVKDPSPDVENVAYRNKFFAYPFIKGSQLQVGIGYPFIF